MTGTNNTLFNYESDSTPYTYGVFCEGYYNRVYAKNTNYVYALHIEGIDEHPITSSCSCVHIEGSNTGMNTSLGYRDSANNNILCAHVEGQNNKICSSYEHIIGAHSKPVYFSTSDFGDSRNALMIVGNGKVSKASAYIADSNRHNAFEVRQSGDIYIADVSAAGNYYEKPMINLQEKLYALDASIQAVAGGSGGGSSFDPTDVNSSISDISTRVNAIETDYVVSNDISTFVTQSALDSSYISLESSIIALDASALAFDASIKELASTGGSGGGSSPFKYVDSKHAIINNDSYYSNSQVGNYAVVLTGYNYDYNNVQATG